MGSGATKQVARKDSNLGQFFCYHFAAASVEVENEGHHFEQAFEAWRGIAEVGLRHTDMVVQELSSWAMRADRGIPPPAHWCCVAEERRLGGTELIMKAFGGVDVSLFMPSLSAEGDFAAERWHKEVGNFARDAAALRHARCVVRVCSRLK